MGVIVGWFSFVSYNNISLSCSCRYCSTQNVKMNLLSYCSFCAEDSFLICTALPRMAHSLQKLNTEHISTLILNMEPQFLLLFLVAL